MAIYLSLGRRKFFQELDSSGASTKATTGQGDRGAIGRRPGCHKANPTIRNLRDRGVISQAGISGRESPERIWCHPATSTCALHPCQRRRGCRPFNLLVIYIRCRNFLHWTVLDGNSSYLRRCRKPHGAWICLDFVMRWRFSCLIAAIAEQQEWSGSGSP